jgi:hypothetical protein
MALVKVRRDIAILPAFQIYRSCQIWTTRQYTAALTPLQLQLSPLFLSIQSRVSDDSHVGQLQSQKACFTPARGLASTTTDITAISASTRRAPGCRRTTRSSIERIRSREDEGLSTGGFGHYVGRMEIVVSDSVGCCWSAAVPIVKT